ncbi:MAG: hypothetical protein AABW91_02370 [Nanoarchaeota archaeon]
MIRKTKKAQSLANFVLVFFTLALVTISLFYILTKENSYDKNFNSPYVLDSVYSREEVINFYLQDIADHSVVGINSVEDKQKLIDNIKGNATKYETASGYVKNEKNEDVLADENVGIVLESMKKLNEDNVEIIVNNGKVEKISVSFDVSINSNSEDLVINYDYRKSFGPRSLVLVEE